MLKRSLALLTVAVLLFGILSTGCTKKPSGPVISEVMAQNNGVLADPDGDYPDWIELHNPTDGPLDLTGYSLADDANQPQKYVLQGLTLAAGEYFVVYASGKDATDIGARVVHLPFALKSSGETVYLYSPEGALVSKVAIPVLDVNQSCGLDANGHVVCFETPTPGAANSAAKAPVSTPVVTSSVKVYINEYTTSNTVTLADQDSDFNGWVELYNYGESDVNLRGFALSDDSDKNDKWLFPEVTLPAGGYLLVFLSGKEIAYQDGSELHATFKLSGDEDSLTLYDLSRKTVDSCPVYSLTSNLSYGRPADAPDEWKFFARATPGAANTVSGFDEIQSALYPMIRAVVINEVAAVNLTGQKASDGKRYDFVELYNPTEEPVSLAGYRLSDKKSATSGCQLPDVTLAAGGYFLVWCGADSEKYDAKTGELFATFGLNRFGEMVYLFDQQNVVVDCFQSGRLDDAQSCGLISTTDNKRYFFTAATPATPNPTKGNRGPVATPVFSVESGYIEAGTAVRITCPGATVHYTTDGSTPTQNSPVYKEPIIVNETVTIRAKAFRDGYMPSDDSSGSYIVGRRHTLPVMFLATDPANLFDEYTGILAKGPGYTDVFPHVGANFWKDWERPVHVDYVDAAGQAQLSFNAGIKVFGQYSRAQNQKSLSINMRDKYGVSEVCYPFFGNSATNVYSELVLRNSGQDIGGAHIRDAFTAMAVKDQMDIDIMDYQPVVVYINGEYYGLYDLREKICEAYVANRTGADEKDIDMIKGNNILMAGDNKAYKEMLDYIKTHDMTVAENYDYICGLIDEDELINYWICESFFSNTDTGNIKFYRQKFNGQWRWILFDLDWALFPSTYQWNMIEEIVNPKGHGVGKMFDTTLMCGLMRNKVFRDKFIRRYITCLRTTFATERLLTIYDQMIAEIEPEMPAHIERWGLPSSMDRWRREVKKLRDIIEKKTALVSQQLTETCTATSGYLPHYFGLTQAEMDAYWNAP